MSPPRSSGFDRFLDFMARLPWWASIAMGGLAWGALWLLRSGWQVVQRQANFWWASGVLWLVFGGAAFGAWITARRHRKKMLSIQTVRDLKAVRWEEFEELVGAYYRERGYVAIRKGEAGKPDGGVDLVLRKDGERVLVQCKKYWRDQIGVAAVREFFGVVVAQGADRGIFITTSRFTPDAMAFGMSQAMLELITGERLAQMVAHLRKPVEISVPAEPEKESAPACPRCASAMVRRIAGKGPRSGQSFWGCRRFPECNGIINIE